MHITVNYLNRNIGSIVVLEPGILHVDTVEEGTEILLLDDGGLVNTCTHLRNLLQIDSLESDVVLFFLFLGDQNTFRGIDTLVDLEAQKVLDFKSLS